MENFFSNAMDYGIFKKAMKVTDSEPVIINVSADDSSIAVPDKKSYGYTYQPRKNMSNKFEPTSSPFGRFFGPQKRTNPVDMNDFKSWKNKNYRDTEQSIDNNKDVTEDENDDFSISGFMKDNSGDTFHELDQAKMEIQKPIEQLSNDDPVLKKFSLDSYMHKLEESIMAKDKFSENDDLLEPIENNDNDSSDNDYGHFTNVAKSINKYQDEDFSFGNSNFEKVAFDGDTSGDKFLMEKAELEKVKKRLQRLERQSNKMNDRNEGIIADNDLLIPSSSTENDDDDENSIGNNLFITEDQLKKFNANQVNANVQNRGKQINDIIVDTGETSETTSATPSNVTLKRPVWISPADVVVDDDEKLVPIDSYGEAKQPVTVSKNSESNNNSTSQRPESNNYITKEDLRDITDDFMTKFSELYKNTMGVNKQPEQVYPQYNPLMQQPYQGINQDYQSLIPQYTPADAAENSAQKIQEYKDSQAELQMKINELVIDKTKTDRETEEKLRQIEEDRKRIDEEYQKKLREMEENYSKKYEEFKQKMYLEKLSSDKKVSENESSIKIRKNIKNSEKHKDFGIILKKEIKSHFNISNLEMEKKLLEVTSKIDKEENKKLKENLSKPNVKTIVKVKTETVQEKPKVEKSQTPARKTTSSKPRTRRKRTRKMDSDIIGGINFD